jgi:hypothetical protein
MQGLAPPEHGSWEAVCTWLRAAAPGPVLLVLENTEEVLTGVDEKQVGCLVLAVVL